MTCYRLDYSIIFKVLAMKTASAIKWQPYIRTRRMESLWKGGKEELKQFKKSEKRLVLEIVRC